MKIITVKINKDGTVEIDFSGYKGKICFEERQRLIELLKEKGLEVAIESETKKPEYYEKEVETEGTLI